MPLVKKLSLITVALNHKQHSHPVATFIHVVVHAEPA